MITEQCKLHINHRPISKHFMSSHNLMSVYTQHKQRCCLEWQQAYARCYHCFLVPWLYFASGYFAGTNHTSQWNALTITVHRSARFWAEQMTQKRLIGKVYVTVGCLSVCLSVSLSVSLFLPSTAGVSQMKSVAIHKLVWWHFQVGWASGLHFVFF